MGDSLLLVAEHVSGGDAEVVGLGYYVIDRAVNSADVTLLVAHFSIPFTMVWMGVSYAMCAASLWPMVALVVPTRELGMAYGLMTALQNLGLEITKAVLDFPLALLQGQK